MSVKHPSNTWVRRMYTFGLIVMAALSMCLIASVVWRMVTSPDEIVIEAISSADESATPVTNSPTTDEVVGKMMEQTNGLVRVHDVGGTVSFQSTSSKTSAPVAPENPYLKK